MAYLTLTQFAKYSLTEAETLSGTILTQDQKINIQNQLASTAELILAQIPDAANYVSFIQNDSFLKGQLAAFQWMLDASTASEKIALEEASIRGN